MTRWKAYVATAQKLYNSLLALGVAFLLAAILPDSTSQIESAYSELTLLQSLNLPTRMRDLSRHTVPPVLPATLELSLLRVLDTGDAKAAITEMQLRSRAREELGALFAGEEASLHPFQYAHIHPSLSEKLLKHIEDCRALLSSEAPTSEFLATLKNAVGPSAWVVTSDELTRRLQGSMKGQSPSRDSQVVNLSIALGSTCQTDPASLELLVRSRAAPPRLVSMEVALTQAMSTVPLFASLGPMDHKEDGSIEENSGDEAFRTLSNLGSDLLKLSPPVLAQNLEHALETTPATIPVLGWDIPRRHMALIGLCLLVVVTSTLCFFTRRAISAVGIGDPPDFWFALDQGRAPLVAACTAHVLAIASVFWSVMQDKVSAWSSPLILLAVVFGGYFPVLLVRLRSSSTASSSS